MFFDLAPKHQKTENQSPRVGFRSICGSIFIDFRSNFSIVFSTFSKCLKSMKSMTLTQVWKVLASQNLSFFHPFSIDFSCFFQNRSRRAFLATKMQIYVKNRDFGTPFRFSQGPKSTLGAPFSRKMVSKSLSFPAGALPEPALRLTTPQNHPRSHFSRFLSILDGFWTDFDGLGMDFGRIFEDFGQICASIFA